MRRRRFGADIRDGPVLAWEMVPPMGRMVPRLHHLRNEKPVREQAHHGLAIREQGA
jgi:hypothetical protein